MKVQSTALIVLGLLVGFQGSANTLNLKDRQIYVGAEVVNGQRSGDKCYITIQLIRPLAEKGLHCHSVDFLFATAREDVPKETLTVDSRITNYHRPEFPKTRTCAVNVNGTTSGNEIYETNTEILYNQIFGGRTELRGVQYDYFLTLSPVTKEAARARVHIQTATTEKDVDCTNLEKM